MERFSPEAVLACGVLHRALVDLSIRTHATAAAVFLARDWRHTWAHFLPALRPSRLRTLVVAALEAQPADVLDRYYRPPTRAQRAQQRLILAPLLSPGSAKPAQGGQIRHLAERVCVERRPDRVLEGARAPEPMTHAPESGSPDPSGACSNRRCKVQHADEFCRRPICHRRVSQVKLNHNTEERMRTRA